MSAPKTNDDRITLGRVFRLWWPLAGSWLLMGIELPLFTAVVARMAEPKTNLAAFSSLVFPIALLIEGPIMMLLAASTALCKDKASYKRIYRFMMATGAALTALHALIAFTPFYYVVAEDVLGVKPQVIEPARIGLMIMTPWTWAIAHRRFHQGVLIRFERSKDVWLGTSVRLVANAGVLALGYGLGGFAGIVVGTSGIVTGVLVEMVYIARRARSVIRGPLRDAPPGEPLSWHAFLTFYGPLALMPILLILAQPIGAASMTRMPAAIDSLACWSAVWGLVFITRSVGFAFNEVVVALAGKPGAVRALRRFVFLLVTVTVGILVLVAATPLAHLWFKSVSGLPDDLASIARLAVVFAVLMPGYQALQSWYQGILLHERRTGAITEAVCIYLAVASVLLYVGVRLDRWTGIHYALVSLSVAGVSQTAWLAWRSRRRIRELGRVTAPVAIDP